MVFDFISMIIIDHACMNVTAQQYYVYACNSSRSQHRHYNIQKNMISNSNSNSAKMSRQCIQYSVICLYYSLSTVLVSCTCPPFL